MLRAAHTTLVLRAARNSRYISKQCDFDELDATQLFVATRSISDFHPRFRELDSADARHTHSIGAQWVAPSRANWSNWAIFAGCCCWCRSGWMRYIVFAHVLYRGICKFTWSQEQLCFGWHIACQCPYNGAAIAFCTRNAIKPRRTVTLNSKVVISR